MIHLASLVLAAAATTLPPCPEMFALSANWEHDEHRVCYSRGAQCECPPTFHCDGKWGNGRPKCRTGPREIWPDTDCTPRYCAAHLSDPCCVPPYPRRCPTLTFDVDVECKHLDNGDIRCVAKPTASECSRETLLETMADMVEAERAYNTALRLRTWLDAEEARNAAIARLRKLVEDCR